MLWQCNFELLLVVFFVLYAPFILSSNFPLHVSNIAIIFSFDSESHVKTISLCDKMCLLLRLPVCYFTIKCCYRIIIEFTVFLFESLCFLNIFLACIAMFSSQFCFYRTFLD